MATTEFMGFGWWGGWGGLHCHFCTNSKVDEGGENCKEKRV